MRPVTLRDARGDSHRVVFGSDGTASVDDGPPLTVRTGSRGRVDVGDGPIQTVWCAASGDVRWVFLNGEVFEIELAHEGRKRAAGSGGEPLAAPMPASVVRVDAKPGDAVKRGDTLVILEAMKMELPVRATSNGTVTAVRCKPGDLVQPGVPLIEIDSAP
jgi:acetyl/propionyl-CoA carboxylase alpha subunit